MTRHALAFAAAIAALSTQPAAAEVIETKGDRFVTRDEATVTVSPRETWLALISPGKWWNAAHTWSGDAANLSLTPQGGGCFCERIPETDTVREIGLAGSAQHMTVVQSQPMKVLRMRGGLGPLQSEPAEGVLTITLQETADRGTKMVWEYVVAGSMRYEVAAISKAVDGVMSEQMNRLADLLGRADAPKATARPDAAEEAEPAGKPESVEDALDAMDAEDTPTAEPR